MSVLRRDPGGKVTEDDLRSDLKLMTSKSSIGEAALAIAALYAVRLAVAAAALATAVRQLSWTGFMVDLLAAVPVGSGPLWTWWLSGVVLPATALTWVKTRARVDVPRLKTGFPVLAAIVVLDALLLSIVPAIREAWAYHVAPLDRWLSLLKESGDSFLYAALVVGIVANALATVLARLLTGARDPRTKG